MGIVFRARDTRLERDVAVKVLPRNLAEDPDALSRFEREAKAVAALSHPNILAIHDFGREEGTVYAAMELLEGETLRQRLQDGALPTRKAIEIALEIAGGPRRRPRQGHRPPRPQAGERVPPRLGPGEGARLRPRPHGPGRPRGADVPTMSLSTEPGRVMGTVGYMAPEQVRGKAVDARADIFSFGARALRDADRQAGLPRREPGGDAERDPQGGPAEPLRVHEERLAGPRAHRPPLPREAARGALPHRPRPRDRPRRDLDLLHAQPHRRGSRGRGAARRPRAASSSGSASSSPAPPSPRRGMLGLVAGCSRRSRTAPPSSAG